MLDLKLWIYVSFKIVTDLRYQVRDRALKLVLLPNRIYHYEGTKGTLEWEN